jgi:hypothetical protein
MAGKLDVGLRLMISDYEKCGPYFQWIVTK